jgi:GNAT superfamily N-acetyltransferase
VAIGRRTVSLAGSGLHLLPATCRDCVRWELDPLSAAQAAAAGGTAQAKQQWWQETLTQGYGGGVLARIDQQTVGYATWSLPEHAGGGSARVTGPVSPDAVLLMALRVEPDHRGKGIGRWLVQAVLRQVLRQPGDRRGPRAVEVFGNGLPGGEGADCLAPTEFWVACGFDVVRQHPMTPRLRLDARRLATWRADVRADVEEAWVRLRGAVRPAPSPTPVPARRGS